MMMMLVLCPKAGSLALMPPGDEISEVVSHCLPHRQLWVSNLSKATAHWVEVDSNLRPSGCKAQNIPLHHRVLYIVTCTAFPHVTLHSQPFPITRLVAVLCYTCYFLPLKGLRALSFVCTAVTLLRIKLARLLTVVTRESR